MSVKKLGAFAGRWKTEGHIHGSGQRLSGTDTYEWLSGECFLVHHVDVRLGDDAMKSIEIIGYDPATDTYPMHYYDSQGNSGVMHASESGGTWRFNGETMRFTGSFSDDGATIRGTWEQRDDAGTWTPWMDVTLAKQR